ncbi:MAG: PEP-CTERM sorting domain-containing protein [Lacipirellulaceae bacterium]
MPAIVLSSTFAVAAPINYGDFPGVNVVYQQVTEDANSAGDAPPLFGAPTVTGDSIDFNPVGFSASATGAGGVDTTDGNLKFTLVAKPGKALNTLLITEAGDATLSGFSNTAFASVTANVFIDILDVDGVPLGAPINVQGNLVFSPSGGTYDLVADGAGNPLFNTGWTGSYTLVPAAVLTANNVPFVFGVTRLSVNLDNTLTALSQAGTSALIAKKDADGVTITTNIPLDPNGNPIIPEPTSLVLAALGLTAVGVSRRR